MYRIGDLTEAMTGSIQHSTSQDGHSTLAYIFYKASYAEFQTRHKRLSGSDLIASALFCCNPVKNPGT